MCQCLSVLFSEPKIPQSKSAYQKYFRFLLSVLFSEPKIPQWTAVSNANVKIDDFQCSSASRKFLNSRCKRPPASGLSFQCSSASRKFLNRNRQRRCAACRLFQCSSASRKFLNHYCKHRHSNKQLLSVLFSEPKIPQYCTVGERDGRRQRFQCSSASRKFLNTLAVLLLSAPSALFQCSSASRKFLNSRVGCGRGC